MAEKAERKVKFIDKFWRIARREGEDTNYLYKVI